MQGVTVQTMNPISASAKGETFELFKGLPGQQITLYHRNKGVSFGNHFHKGVDQAKDPEYFFLISGQVTASFYNGLTGERETLEIGQSDLLTINKNIYHSLTALTKVTFIEYRSQVFDEKKNDCWPLEEYEAYLETLKKQR